MTTMSFLKPEVTYTMKYKLADTISKHYYVDSFGRRWEGNDIYHMTPLACKSDNAGVDTPLEIIGELVYEEDVTDITDHFTILMFKFTDKDYAYAVYRETSPGFGQFYSYQFLPRLEDGNTFDPSKFEVIGQITPKV